MARSRRSRAKSAPYNANNRATLLRGGKPYFDALIEHIEQAKHSIHLQVYIFDADETGKMVMDSLIAAARRQVAVHVLVDGYASQGLSGAFIKECTAAGIHFRSFEPLFKSRKSYFGRRLHHKIVAIDGRFALVGGINISNKYNDRPDQPAWLDFALLFEGELVCALEEVALKLWQGNDPEREASPTPGKISFSFDPGETCELRIRQNDWVRKKNEISKSYIQMFNSAREEIIMMSGYFLPGRIIRRAMSRATKRGVKIKLILAGISDVMVSKFAERFMYNWIFKHQIELYEYKPCVLHGKIAVADGGWATIGSYNVNDISALASVELNIDVNSAGTAAAMQATLQKIIGQDCTRITRENFAAKNGFFHRLWQRVCYLFIRSLFWLFTLNFKQQG